MCTSSFIWIWSFHTCDTHTHHRNIMCRLISTEDAVGTQIHRPLGMKSRASRTRVVVENPFPSKLFPLLLCCVMTDLLIVSLSLKGVLPCVRATKLILSWSAPFVRVEENKQWMRRRTHKEWIGVFSMEKQRTYVLALRFWLPCQPCQDGASAQLLI